MGGFSKLSSMGENYKIPQCVPCLGLLLRLIIGLDNLSRKTPNYDHNYLLASAFLNQLRSVSPELSETIHDMKTTAPYVLSEIYSIKGVAWKHYFCVATSSDVLVNNIEKAFRPGSEILIGDVRLGITDIRKESIFDDMPSPLEVTTLSPVLVRDGSDHGRCKIPKDSNYIDELNKLVASKVQKFAGENDYCRVIRVEAQDIRRRHISNGVVLATKGRFYLEGTSKALKFILEHGLGANPGMGFGFVVPSGGW